MAQPQTGRIGFKLIMLLFIGINTAALIWGCGPRGFFGITPTATPITPTSTPSPTRRVCPSGTPFTMPSATPADRQLIVVVFDPNESVRGLEFADGSRTTDILWFSRVVLEKAAEPGDGYAIFWLGSEEFVVTRILNVDSRYIEAPSFPSTPARPAAWIHPYTPTAIYDQNRSIIWNINQNITQTEEYDRMVATMTQEYMEGMFRYDCAIGDYAEEFAAEQIDWESTRTASVSVLMHEIDNALLTSTAESWHWPTPFSENVVLEGIEEAAWLIKHEDETHRYDRRVLLIFDDMIERNIGPTNEIVVSSHLQNALVGVDVVVVMVQCDEVYQPNCASLQEMWEKPFQELGAEPPLYLDGRRLEETFLTFLGRQ